VTSLVGWLVVGCHARALLKQPAVLNEEDLTNYILLAIALLHVSYMQLSACMLLDLVKLNAKVRPVRHGSSQSIILPGTPLSELVKFTL